jgi:hypothetical protein
MDRDSLDRVLRYGGDEEPHRGWASNAVSTDPRTDAWRDRLARSEYPLLAGEFIRYRDDPTDDVIGAVVREVTSQGPQVAAELRQALDRPSVETLQLFSMRRALQGQRRASLGALTESMASFALLPALTDVPWESWLKAVLLIGRTLGVDVETVAAPFRDVALADAVARLDVATESMSRIEDLTQCHIAQVSTNYGTGFVETLVFRGVATMGLFGAPNRLGDNVLTFDPATNIAQLAASVADALDASGRVTTPLGQDQLAATTFSLTIAGSYLATTGCLSCVAEGTGGVPSFNVLVAELPVDVDVDELARAAGDTDDQRALVDGQRIIILSGVPDFTDADVPDVDLSPFVDIVRTVLDGPAARVAPSPTT